MTVLIIIIAVVVIVLIAIMLSYKNQEKITNNTVLCFTGGLGSGKTYMAVKMAVKFYKRQNLKYLVGKALNVKKWLDKPHLISNIPIRINKKRYSEVLTREHLLLEQDIPEKAVILIDEVGQVASQYDYDNPYVMCEIQELIRFFRHYTAGKLILTDQSSANIVVPIRRRINIIYNLNDFRRYFKLLPFYKVDVSPLEVTEESVINTVNQNTQEKHLLTTVKLEKPYFFGVLPYKWQKFKRYDSRCYSIRYNHDLKLHNEEQWEKLKTAYIIDVEATESERKDYKKFRKSVNRVAVQDLDPKPNADYDNYSNN